MWIAGLTVLFAILVLVDFRQLVERKNKKEWILYSSLMITAFSLNILSRLHIFPLEWFSPIKLITKMVETLVPMAA